MVRQELEIVNRLGLHARAAAKLVNTASGFASRVEVEYRGQRVNAKSIMGVMMLAAGLGSRVLIEVAGEDEAEALAAVESLFRGRFGEPE